TDRPRSLVAIRLWPRSRSPRRSRCSGPAHLLLPERSGVRYWPRYSEQRITRSRNARSFGGRFFFSASSALVRRTDSILGELVGQRAPGESPSACAPFVEFRVRTISSFSALSRTPVRSKEGAKGIESPAGRDPFPLAGTASFFAGGRSAGASPRLLVRKYGRPVR